MSYVIISEMTKQIPMIKLILESTHKTIQLLCYEE